MGIASKYNKGGASFTAKPAEGTGYCKLKDMAEAQGFTPETTFKVGAVYLNNKGKYGTEAVAYITDPYTALVNLPQHMVDTISDMRNDPEAVEAINAGKLGFTVYEYTGNNGTGYSINFVDL